MFFFSRISFNDHSIYHQSLIHIILDLHEVGNKREEGGTNKGAEGRGGTGGFGGGRSWSRGRGDNISCHDGADRGGGEDNGEGNLLHFHGGDIWIIREKKNVENFLRLVHKIVYGLKMLFITCCLKKIRWVGRLL